MHIDPSSIKRLCFISVLILVIDVYFQGLRLCEFGSAFWTITFAVLNLLFDAFEAEEVPTVLQSNLFGTLVASRAINLLLQLGGFMLIILYLEAQVVDVATFLVRPLLL